jgi:microcystin degradation protein MlrC
MPGLGSDLKPRRHSRRGPSTSAKAPTSSFRSDAPDIGLARWVVVKSRGHFRGGFDEFFGPDQIVEVALPGLTSPMLNHFTWTRLPRPVIPLNDNVEWHPPTQ